MITLLRKLTIMLSVAGALASCSSPPTQENRVDFICPEGEIITATFMEKTKGRASVAITLPDGTKLDLPQALSGSGARYSDGEMTLWNKGDMVFFMKGDNVVFDNCKASEK